MNTLIRTPFFVGLVGAAALVSAAAQSTEKAAASQGDGNTVSGNSATTWTQEANAKGILIHSRVREGSSLKEFKGEGVIEAPPGTVFAVLDDSEAYPDFMPYTSECRILKREKDCVLTYQRLEVPLVNDRDFTLRSQNSKWLGPEGIIYRIRWATANPEGPANKPGVSRVGVCDGGWLLEPEGAGSTRATYSVFTDSALPPFIANNGSRIGIRKIFEAVRKRVKDPKYSSIKGAQNKRADGPELAEAKAGAALE